MRIRHARFLAALLATTALGVGGAEIAANLTARAELRHVLDHQSGLTVGSIFAEPFTGRLTLHGVATGHGAVRLTIGTLSVPLTDRSFGLITPAAASPFDDKSGAPGSVGPLTPPDDNSETPAAPAAPAVPAPAPPVAAGGNAFAENVVLTDGSTTFHIKRIDMTGTTLSNADLAALLDSKSTEPLEARLRKLNAAAIVVPEVIVDDTTTGSQSHTTMTQILLSGANGGKISGGSIGATSFSIKTSDDVVNGTVGAIQVSGIDFAQITHVFNTVRSDESEPILPLFESVTATSLKVANDSKKSLVTVATLKETGAKARALQSELLSKPGIKLTSEQQNAAFDDMVRSFAFGSIDMTGMVVQTTDGTPNAGTMTLTSLSMHDFGAGRFGGMSLRAFRFDGPQAKMGLGAFDLGPFTIPSMKSVKTLNLSTGTASPFSTMTLSQLEVDVPPKETGGSPVKFKVGSAGFASDGTPGDLPTTAKLNIDNIVFDIPPGAPPAQPIYDMGYRHLNLSFGLATAYDAAAQSLSIHDLRLHGANMGSVTLGFNLANVTKGLASPNQEIVKAAAMAILAKSMTLDLVNEGLVDRALAWKAQQDGVDVAKEKQALIDMYNGSLPPPLAQHPNVKIISAAIIKFITDPKNLHIGIASKSGLGVGSMGLLNDPALLADTLDVQATANQ